MLGSHQELIVHSTQKLQHQHKNHLCLARVVYLVHLKFASYFKVSLRHSLRQGRSRIATPSETWQKLTKATIDPPPRTPFEPMRNPVKAHQSHLEQTHGFRGRESGRYFAPPLSLSLTLSLFLFLNAVINQHENFEGV